MNWLNPLFLISITTGPIFILMGFIMLKFPPREINNLYGYRTSNSMKSQERWNFAQRFSAKEFIKWGMLLTATALVGLFVKVNEVVGVVVALIILILSTVLLIRSTEKALKRKFNDV